MGSAAVLKSVPDFRRRVEILVTSVLVLGATAVAQAAPAPMTPREYELYVEWKDGREDPRLAQYNDEIKLKKIAASLGVSVDELERAIEKAEKLVPTLDADTRKAIRATLDETPLKGRVLDVVLDLSASKVVAYVKWRCGEARDADLEASYAAWAVSRGGSVVDALGLWCVGDNDVKLFSATIGRTAFEKIKKETIERFASTRYIKLFEAVKRGPHT